MVPIMVAKLFENELVVYGVGGIIVLGLIIWIYNSSPVQSAVAAAGQVGAAVSAAATAAGQNATTFVNNATTQNTLTNALVTGVLGPFGAIGQSVVDLNKLDDYITTGAVPAGGN